MCKIVLKDIISHGNLPESGRKLYELLNKYLSSNQTIFIDMTDVVSLPTLFMNTSFGTIIEESGVELLKKNIKFDNITKSQMFRIQKYLDDYASIQNNKSSNT